MNPCPETGLPLGESKPALDFPHFPTRCQAVIWRNWGMVTPACLAHILETTPARVVQSARDLGLGAAATPDRERLWRQRGYLTLIRQNWHLLSYPQLLTLLDWSADQLAYALKEDDFLWAKLGGFKPVTPPVAWTALNTEAQAITDAIRQTVGDRLSPEAFTVEPFAFLNQFGHAQPLRASPCAGKPFDLKLLYAYAAVYGDPLLDPALDPYPDGLLADLKANGINGVWLQGVLYTLVPWTGDPTISRGHETRIANLNALVARAARFGIGVYLYLNEPRAMPSAFFEAHPGWRGPLNRGNQLHAMCLSDETLVDALRDGVADLFRKVPNLAGVVTITCSENLTHCDSKAHGAGFPVCVRCADKAPDALVATVNNAIADGIHSVSPEAAVIAWDWGWEPAWSANVVGRLRSGIQLLCTSEAYLETDLQGIKGRVGDYTISKIGPGFMAEDHWSHARARGMKTLAKVQLNNSWECSAVPYLPVPFLVQEHLRKLESRLISGLMVGWTLGGYPGGNLELVRHDPETIATERFGPLAPVVTDAWRRFGEAFRLFPVHGAMMLYHGPQNYGPMNLLFAKPSGFRSTMVGFPYDDLPAWRSNLYPPEGFEDAFRQLTEGWRDGLALLQNADLSALGPESRAAFDDLATVAHAAYCHFRTTYLQMRFIRLRDRESADAPDASIDAVLSEEIELALALLAIVQRDSRIGFEASNHYYYTAQHVMEKVLNCRQIQRERLVADGRGGRQSAGPRA